MTTAELKRTLTAALSAVRHPSSGRDIVASGHVQGLEVSADGDVHFSFHLKPEDPGSLVREARAAAEGVEGVSAVRVDVQLPRTAGGAGAGAAAGPQGGGPPRGAPSPKRGLQPGSVPAPTPKPGLLADVTHVIAVSSGKGGVGKSMVSSNLAAAFAMEGLKVGLLDADIYGPNIPRMFGESRRPEVSGEKGSEMIVPLDAHGVRLMSLGFLLEDEQPAIMRGPLIAGILKQFMEQVAWGPLDVMIVDMPPGTGDAQLSLVQTIDLDGAVMVTTPQGMSTGDVRRGIKMFERVNTRVLGIVENMGSFACPHCGDPIDIFESGGGERLAEQMGVPFLASIPLDPAVRRAGEEGRPTVLSAPESPAGRALGAVASNVLEIVRGNVRAGAARAE